MLFGSGQFDDVFGDVIATLCEIFEEGMNAENKEKVPKKNSEQEEYLARKLRVKLEPHIQGEIEGTTPLLSLFFKITSFFILFLFLLFYFILFLYFYFLFILLALYYFETIANT